MNPHPANILPNGEYDQAMYDIDFERDGKGRYRVVRGFGNQIGWVFKNGRYWGTEAKSEGKFGPLWQSRLIAGHMLSHAVPLTDDADAEDFRVTPD
ncbi:hypothetical protein [Streptomyces sp. NPDC001404]|uniref:hypothetical protein n=1 Tax=Streptomyces sp. NPDC001404 TaxID=3364571 RepID=UPI0036CCEA84